MDTVRPRKVGRPLPDGLKLVPYGPSRAVERRLISVGDFVRSTRQRNGMLLFISQQNLGALLSREKGSQCQQSKGQCASDAKFRTNKAYGSRREVLT